MGINQERRDSKWDGGVVCLSSGKGSYAEE